MRLWQKWLLMCLVPVFLVVSVIAAYQYQVKASIEDFFHSLKPIARIGYGDINTSISGHVSITDLKIQPLKYQNVITLRELSFDLPSAVFVFTGKSQLQEGILSAPFLFSLTGLDYDLEADYALDSGSTNESSDQCLQGGVDVRLLQSLGYQHVRGDIKISFIPDLQSNILNIGLSANLSELAQAQFDLRLLVNEGRFFNRAALAKAGVETLNLAVNDSGYNPRWLEYCSTKQELTKDELLQHYREGLVNQLGLDEQQDNTRLLDSLVNVKMSGAQVAAHLKVAPPVSIERLVGMDGVDLVLANADFNLQANGRVLDISDADWNTLRTLFADNVRKAAMVVVNKEEAPLVDKPKKSAAPEMREIIPGVMPIRLQEKVKTYQATSFEELSSYIGSPIRLKTFFGNDMEGTLLSVSTSAVSIQHHVEQGRASFPVSKDKIASIEVYR